MDWIAHRGDWTSRSDQNSLPALERAFAKGWGIETDVRQWGGQLFLSHDPIRERTDLAPWDHFVRLREAFPHCPVFLNIKEDGLLPLLLHDLTRSKGTTVCFDMSVPELVLYAQQLPAHRLATRVSEFESAPLAEHCDWVWCDSFHRSLRLDRIEHDHPQLWGKSLALVSPELHGRARADFAERAACLARRWPARVAVCTDPPEAKTDRLTQWQGSPYAEQGAQ